MLSIRLICVGKLKEKFYLEACREYEKRLGTLCRLEILQLDEEPDRPGALAKEAAELGFAEILLTDVSYPTVGKLDKIDYGEGEKSAHLAAFLEEMRAALEPYGVVLSIEVSEAVIAQGSDEDAGLMLADIAPRVDRIYAPTAAAEVPALTRAVRAVSQAAEFVPELTEADSAAGSFLVS